MRPSGFALEMRAHADVQPCPARRQVIAALVGTIAGRYGCPRALIIASLWAHIKQVIVVSQDASVVDNVSN